MNPAGPGDVAWGAVPSERGFGPRFVAPVLIGPVLNSNQAALYRQAPPDQIGTASGLSRTSVYLAAIGSSAVIGLVFGEQPTDAGLHAIGWLVLAAGAGATVLAAVDRALGPRRG